MPSDDYKAEFEKLRKRAVENELSSYIDSKNTGNSFYNRYAHCLNEITKAAADYAIKSGLTVDEFEDGPLEGIENGPLYKAIDVLSSLSFSLLTHDQVYDGKVLPSWRHEKFPIDIIKYSDVPYMEREGVEMAATDYLDLPFRVRAVDRLFADVLIALELYAFGDEMLNEETPWGFPARSPLKKKHVFQECIFDVFIAGIVLLSPAALSLYAGSREWISVGWAEGIALVFGGLFSLILIFNSIRLPFAWKSQRAEQRNILKLLTEMVSIYHELDSSGVISAHHISERVSEASKLGVVWPGPLNALLDDAIKRTGRL